MAFNNLPTLAEMQAERRAPQKGLPRVLEKKAKQKSKDEQDKAFRAAVWTRDESKCRATRKPLKRSGMNWSTVGEVHHVLKRSTNPDRIYDVSNGILMSKEQHALASTRCPNATEFYLLSIDGPEDMSQPQTFTWRNADGIVTKTRVG